jgi:PAS domain S-box-containing protein
MSDDKGRVHAAGGGSAAFASSSEVAAAPWPVSTALDDAERLRRLLPGLQSWHVAARYAIALGAVVAAIALRWALDPILGDRLPFAPLLIVLLPLLLLVRPATFLAAALFGLAISRYLFISPRFTFLVDDPVDVAQMAIYGFAMVGAAVAAWLSHDLRRRILAAKERLSFARSVSSVGFFSVDYATGLVSTDGIARLFGLPAEPASRTREAWETHIVPEDLSNAKRELALAIEQRLDDVDFEYRVLRPDGSTRWLAARARLSYSSAGKAVRLAGATVDITDRKRAEEGLRESAALLRQADRRKDEFLAALAHELRNPLAPIRNAAAVLRSERSTERIDWCRDVIERQTAHLTRLVDDLLDVSRISHGKLVLRKEAVELAQIVKNAVEIAQPVLDRRSHALAVALPTAAVRLEADPVRLAQVFANLLNNAAKYSPEGAPIRLTAERRDSEIVVSVVDHGIGIPAEALAHVFDIFSQAQAPLDLTESGLGLGLAIVRKLVDLHGGSVAAHSAGRGQGSEFVVRLPTAADREDPKMFVPL